MNKIEDKTGGGGGLILKIKDMNVQEKNKEIEISKKRIKILQLMIDKYQKIETKGYMILFNPTNNKSQRFIFSSFPR